MSRCSTRKEGREQWVGLRDNAGHVENAFDTTCDGMQDRLSVAAQTLEAVEEMLVTVDHHASSDLEGRTERVGAGVLFTEA